MKGSDRSTGAGATRDGDDVSTDPALSSHTYTGSADRVTLRITPTHSDTSPGSVKVIDAANQPVSTTAPPEEIAVRQLYPDTIEPATAPRPAPPRTPPPGAVAHAHGQGRMPGMSRVSRRAWFGIAAIIVALLAIGFLALQSFGRTSTVILPTASATAIVQATATPALSVAPTLAPTVILAPTAAPAPTDVPLVSTPTTPTESPLPTVTPTEVALPTVAPTPAPAPTTAPTEAPVAAPITAPSAVPPTSVPAAPPAPAVAPAAPAVRPAIPPLPPGIPVPSRIPSVPQIPRKP
jgi:hypothetical protein